MSSSPRANEDPSCRGEMYVKSAKAQSPMCLATLNTVPQGLGSNPGEDMDVCKCIVPSRHEGTLNSRQAASPLVRLVEGEKGERPLTLPGVFSL
ncbi:uncharacterized protein TNCV_1132111 [Trichonephila clavipes]|nr:uncharacterized protein TNCV_1132111 [Trichonephila clavipes]